MALKDITALPEGFGVITMDKDGNPISDEERAKLIKQEKERMAKKESQAVTDIWVDPMAYPYGQPPEETIENGGAANLDPIFRAIGGVTLAVLGIVFIVLAVWLGTKYLPQGTA